MPTYQALEQHRQELISQISELPPMRVGTLQHQYLPRKRKDGSVVRRGPYWTYTFKENGKTQGRHLSDSEAELYGEQTQNCRRFRAICDGILEISQQMADLAMSKNEGKKNSRSASRRKNRPKPNASRRA
jgi:hypothetical protein